MRVKHKKSGKEYEVRETTIDFDCTGFKKGDAAYRGQPINAKTGKPWQAIKYFPVNRFEQA